MYVGSVDKLPTTDNPTSTGKLRAIKMWGTEDVGSVGNPTSTNKLGALKMWGA